MAATMSSDRIWPSGIDSSVIPSPPSADTTMAPKDNWFSRGLNSVIDWGLEGLGYDGDRRDPSEENDFYRDNAQYMPGYNIDGIPSGAWAQDRATVYCRRHWSANPDFTAEPTVSDVTVREAALRLGREWMNRRERSALTAGIRGGPAEAFFLLSAALADVRAYEVRVGGYESTRDSIAERILD